MDTSVLYEELAKELLSLDGDTRKMSELIFGHFYNSWNDGYKVGYEQSRRDSKEIARGI